MLKALRLMRTATWPRPALPLLSILAFGVPLRGAERWITFGDCRATKERAGAVFHGDRVLLSNLGWLALAPNKKGAGTRGSLNVFPEPATVQSRGGRREATVTKTLDALGFTCRSVSRFYPNRMTYALTYRFDRNLEGYHLYLNPVVNESFALGAKYEAIDVDGLWSEGVVAPWPETYRHIPRKGIGLRDLSLSKNGLTAKVSVKTQHASADANNLRIDFVRDDGKFADRREGGHVRLWLTFRPPGDAFPAGFENTLELAIAISQRR